MRVYSYSCVQPFGENRGAGWGAVELCLTLPNSRRFFEFLRLVLLYALAPRCRALPRLEHGALHFVAPCLTLSRARAHGVGSVLGDRADRSRHTAYGGDHDGPRSSVDVERALAMPRGAARRDGCRLFLAPPAQGSAS